MAELFDENTLPPITRHDMIAECDREIAMRRQVYPRLEAKGKLRPGEGAHRIRIMEMIKGRLMNEMA